MNHRYLVELAVMAEMPGWTLRDIDESPADLIDVILYRRRARLAAEEERRERGA